MRAPPHYSVSPLPSIATVSTQPTVSFVESLRAIWRWWRPQPVPLRERIREREWVERLAEELAEAERAGPGEKS
jgi:hypothetical protein